MMKHFALPNREILQKTFDKYAEARTRTLRELETRIAESLRILPSSPGIKGRTKDFSSYFSKYLRILKLNPEAGKVPLITDLIGIRIVCPFIEDLATVEALIKNKFEVIEVERKGQNHTFREFGYKSIHLLVKIPGAMLAACGPCGCEVAEVQIRTILQDAWAEVEHELVYKAQFTPFDDPMKRKLAAVNANLSLADIIFQEIRTYQRQLNSELDKRRNSFFRKIEESTDALLFAEEKSAPPSAGTGVSPPLGGETIDDLFLNALSAHNKNQFDEAIGFYSRILEMNPPRDISSLIYKHRGMAYFARSHYEEAILDFTKALELDPKSYKAPYYRGVVSSVLRRYSEAIEAFTQSLEINPYQAYCLYRRSQAWYHLEDYPQALADCEAAIALEPFEAAKKLRGILREKLRM
jgi:putative GTP pyrophosphokinase